MSHQGFFRRLIDDLWWWVDTWIHPEIASIAHEKAGGKAAFEDMNRDQREAILVAAVDEFERRQRQEGRR